MDESRLIVIVISSVWEVSTWMFAEFEAAIRADVKASYQKILVWDPGEFGFSFPQHDKLIELLPKLAGDAGEVISSRLEAIRR
jgi:hypothetical protein